jgi:hypothetical protein
MLDLFGDLQGVLIYFDDFLVMGDTLKEVEANLRRVLLRCRKVNLKLKIKKCRFFLKKIPWLGHIVSHGSLKVVAEKNEAFVNMPAPTDKQVLVR